MAVSWLRESGSGYDAPDFTAHAKRGNTDCLSFEGAGFLPIGNYNARFTGLFDGGGYRIMGLVINREQDGYVGLFGCVSAKVPGTTRNLSKDNFGW
ncbi:MAG: hypothetical protein KGZ79_03340 [Dethiobacter sp.]|jgi:hypothetical protein|nr:hypothetical protein [Dethiobacter sp.]